MEFEVILRVSVILLAMSAYVITFSKVFVRIQNALGPDWTQTMAV